MPTRGRRSSRSCARAPCPRRARRGPTRPPTTRWRRRSRRALDRAAAARPRVGTLPLAHRLSRTEYRNAVRDLLALGDLPKELSIDYLLPADNSSSGFDTIADLLFVSPSAMERYLDAAQKISRLAVGDTTLPVLVNIHPLDPEHPQDERVDDLPFGTRGGLAVRSDFPVDGTYTVKVELAGGAGRDRHQLEVTVDGERVKLETLGGAPAGRGGRGGGAPDPRLEFPLAIKAGPRLIGVAFVQRTEARDEATLRPRTRSRGTQPAIASVTISGPHGASTPGDSPSRRRIFVCRPSGPADEVPCATRILSSLARRAYRRPVADVDLRDLMPFFQQGRAAGSFDLGIQKALERMLVSSQFLFRIERPWSAGSKDPATYGRTTYRDQRSRAGVAAVVLPVEQHPGRRAARRRRCRPVETTGRARAPGPAHAGGRAVVGARHQLRGAVALPARHRSQAARRSALPGLRRDAARRDGARDRALRRERVPREPQRGRSAQRPTTRSSTSGWRSTTASRTSAAATSAASRCRRAARAAACWATAAC